MSGHPRAHLGLFALLLLAPALTGCIGTNDEAADAASVDDLVDGAVDWAVELPDRITGIEHLTRTDGMESGYQVALDGDIAYVAAWNAGFYTVDVSTPESPQVLAHLTDHFGHDAWVMDYDDGRKIVALAGSGDGIAFIDVTDPREPVILSTILGQSGTEDIEGANVHNIAVAPGTHVIYNSRSVDTPGVDIVDASDPENPELVAVFNDLTCHDIAFWAEGQRAYCAGIRETQIWDVADPTTPEIVSRVVAPAGIIHHWALPARNGTLLIIGDEFLGATGPFANACTGGVENPVTGATTTHPIGALWFLDISDETTPVPLSYVGAGELHPLPEACTAHFGELIGDRDQIIVGFLAGGVYLIDFSDVEAPRMLDHVDLGDSPDVQVHNGYAFSAGRGQGLDVLTFEG